MPAIERQRIEQNYKKLGALTDRQFLAVKSLSQRMIYAVNVDLNYIRLLKNGMDTIANITKLNIGDTIKIRGTVRGMVGGNEQSGVITLQNITDIIYKQGTEEFLIANNDTCVTNMDCGMEMMDLASVINDQSNWVTKEELANITYQATLSDFDVVRGSQEREQEKSIGFDGLDDFGHSGFDGKNDKHGFDNEINTPDLMF